MDRREFLRTLFSAASLAALGPREQLVAFQRQRFDSPLLSFGFRIPDGWVTNSQEECRFNLEKQTYVEENVSPEEISPTPLLSVTRYREPWPEMNPGVLIYADRRPDWMGEAPLEVIEDYVDYFPTIVENGRCIQSPGVEQWNGATAATTAISYTCTTTEGFHHDVVDRSAFVFHRDYLLGFVFEDSLFPGPGRATTEFNLIRSTTQFV